MDLNIFLSRLLFCFFAEDTEIFDTESIFTNTLAQHTAENGSDTHTFLNTLFLLLNTPTNERQKLPSIGGVGGSFPYVNGGLFKDTIASPLFTAKARKFLIELGELNWREINPDIFGSMIQAVVMPEYRSDLGMHYTSVPNILKLIRPLFLDELYEVFENCKTIPQLRKLLNRLSKIKFLDPACGSGNFLIITYKEIRLLEIKIIQQIIELSAPQLETHYTQIQLSQFYGIELDDFAHEMAILSLWLAEHQMNKVFEDRLLDYGRSKPILPLKQAGQIVQGNAARKDWKEVCPITPDDEVYIIGNPPYLGARVQDEEQKRDMDLVFQTFPKYKDLDYISVWFFKAKKYIEGLNAKAAFVSTNSVCQGQQVALLWPNILKNGTEIAFAYLSFKWTNNAKGNAGVTVIVLGLRNKSTEPKFLFNENIKKEAKNINAYLLDGAEVIIAERMLPISKFPKMNFGNMPNDGGGLILTEEEKNILLSESPKASKFVRILLGSAEYIRGDKRYCLWIEDEDLEEAIQIPFIQKRIKITQTHRLSSKDTGTNELARRSHQFRDRNVAKESQLIIPGVSSERRDYIPIGYLGNDTVISNSALVIYDAAPYLFAVVNSKMHMVWVNAVGGKLKTDYRYSAKLCYNTFPFPDISLKQKETLGLYVYGILDERAKHPEKTMAQLYDPDKMPAGLRIAHQELDRAVEQCYRLQPFTTDTERLEYLFRLYEEMSKEGTLFAKQKKTKKK
ncbi:MAG: class I SAM-dependent DNA methyltransferase [Cytophagia bacterium]|nr:MAG: class I SAM-dependent DNA methyltransferase [Cytophagales bacterium]TAG38560.1 MAG: class I SAM-dependent DNA methyltransferase [Cytophagia bacterium]TAG80158.1 MAG: class I SAM-dependent DNA methyltransferase [Cytophagales bacterium]